MEEPAKEIARLEGDQAATAGEFQSAVAELTSTRDGFDREFVEAIVTMRDNLTEDEWRVAFPEG